MAQWYKVIPDAAYCKNFLEIFYCLHDYVVSGIRYSYEADMVEFFFLYDDATGVLLRFTGIKDFHFSGESIREECAWLSGATVKLTENGEFFFYMTDSDFDIEDAKKKDWLNRIEAKEMLFAYVDKNGNILPLTEQQLHPAWEIWGEKVQKHFTVYPAEQPV